MILVQQFKFSSLCFGWRFCMERKKNIWKWFNVSYFFFILRRVIFFLTMKYKKKKSVPFFIKCIIMSAWNWNFHPIERNEIQNKGKKLQKKKNYCNNEAMNKKAKPIQKSSAKTYGLCVWQAHFTWIKKEFCEHERA